MTSTSRAQRLVDEFQEGAAFVGGHSIRHGIAAVLRHLADTDAQYGDEESFYAIPARTLEDLADTLTAPTLLERAMAEPEPPADGEVAELVEWLWSMHELAGEHNPEEQCRYARAADLLERLAPQPVPEGPTRRQLMMLADDMDMPSLGDAVSYARAVLARWGTPNLAQVRSSLGDGPAVPESREPAAVVGDPSDEDIMALMPQQMHEDLAAAARALAEQAGTDSRSATGIMRIILNRHAVDLARAVLARWGRQPAPDASAPCPPGG